MTRNLPAPRWHNDATDQQRLAGVAGFCGVVAGLAALTWQYITLVFL